MKKLFIAVASALALLLAGVSYAAQEAGDAKPAQEMKQETMKKSEAKPKAKKSASKKKCAKGEVYNKKDKKCEPKA